ncbi:hypothetical protein GY45DRAFT_1326344 [Cubamyces sp. BRFM 1775]|nr:hypothetical protein GY45DRAFT_1326344 [Cubamyces sp. BRFM 1775]
MDLWAHKRGRVHAAVLLSTQSARARQTASSESLTESPSHWLSGSRIGARSWIWVHSKPYGHGSGGLASSEACGDVQEEL